jgi:hypothetical protein
MKNSIKKLFLVIPVQAQDDLLPVVESEGWYTVTDLFRKTGTSFNSHWNGNYVLDQDEIPWKATQEEINSLAETNGRVIVLSGVKYNITDPIMLLQDKDGSVYVFEEQVEDLINVE